MTLNEQATQITEADYEAEKHDDDHHTVEHFYSHFKEVLLFGFLFLLMCALPVALSGIMVNFDIHVWDADTNVTLKGMEGTLYALGLFTAFILGLVVMFIAPALIGFYMFLVVSCLFLFHPERYFSPEVNFLGIFYLAMVVAGSFALPRPKELYMEKEEEEAIVPVATAETSATDDSAGAEEEAPVKKIKPVAFDRAIAAEGVTVIFGTESGNSEGLAEVTVDKLKAAGFSAQMLDAEKVDITHLPAFSNCLVITSTWGDGDPPSNAVDLVGDMKSDPGISMKGTQFSVLSLGDTAYEQFCKCGKDFDELFEKFGSKRFFKRVDCDLDYDELFEEWATGTIGALQSGGLLKQEQFVEAEPAAV